MRLNKISSMVIMLALSATLFGTTANAQTNYNDNNMSDQNYMRDRDRNGDRDWNRDHDYNWNYHRRNIRLNDGVYFRGDRNYFMNNWITRYFRIHYNPYFRGNFCARKVIIIDRDYPSRTIVIRNRCRGPYTVNESVISVNSNFFARISNAVDISNVISIDANTGNNNVIFNTGVGRFETGDVNIRIN